MEKVITAIEGQKKNPRRVNISMINRVPFGLSRIVAAWLKVGQYLSEKQIKDLQVEDSVESAYQKSLFYLGHRTRSEYEVRKRISKYGFDNNVIQKVISRLVDKQYLSDREFAQEWVENRITFRPRSRSMLRYELRQKRVPEDIIAHALHNIPDEGKLAEKAAKKHSRRLRGLDRRSFQKKLVGYLSRRGFSYDIVKSAIDKLWNEEFDQLNKKNGNEEMKYE